MAKYRKLNWGPQDVKEDLRDGCGGVTDVTWKCRGDAGGREVTAGRRGSEVERSKCQGSSTKAKFL